MQTSSRSLSVFALTMINIAAICNIKNFPLSALYGLSAVFFYALAALIYFIPIAFVSAELATGWPKRGIYTWVSEAMGGRMGFLAVWLQWVENIIWYPTILSFIAGTMAYTFNPEYANHKLYVLFVVLTCFWAVTFLNFLGMRVSGWISTMAALLGTIIPGFFIITLGFVWWFTGQGSQTPLNWSAFFPDLSNINQLVIFSGILLALAGMEMSGVHATEVENPQKDYPKAIFISSLIILFLSSVGSLSVAIVVPKNAISLASGSMEAFSVFLGNYQINWLIPFIALIMSLGALGMMSTWIVGPTKGVFAAAIDGDLPPLFQKRNKKDMPTTILLVQALFVTLLSSVFLFMPSVSSSYWILVNMTVQIYLIMYFIMFLSAIILRYKQPDTPRPYRIPGKYGLHFVAGLGMLSCLFSFLLGFLPPEQIDTGSAWSYELILIVGIAFFILAPLVIYANKQESWNLQKSPRGKG
ncbi:MAG: APC family permease [Chlamydiota bacterium]